MTEFVIARKIRKMYCSEQVMTQCVDTVRIHFINNNNCVAILICVKLIRAFEHKRPEQQGEGPVIIHGSIRHFLLISRVLVCKDDESVLSS